MEPETRTNLTIKEDLKRLLPGPRVLLGWLVLAGAFVLFYRSSIRYLVQTWWTQEDYQHGFFVPIFALVLLWLRRDMIVPFSGRGAVGLPLFGLWAAMMDGGVLQLRHPSRTVDDSVFRGCGDFVEDGQGALGVAGHLVSVLDDTVAAPSDGQPAVAGPPRLSIFVIKRSAFLPWPGNVIQLTEHPEVAHAQGCG